MDNKLDINLTLNQYLSFHFYPEFNGEPHEYLHYIVDRLAEVDDIFHLIYAQSWYSEDWEQNIKTLIDFYIELQSYRPVSVSEATIGGTTYRLPEELNCSAGIEGRQILYEWSQQPAESLEQRRDNTFNGMCKIAAFVLDYEDKPTRYAAYRLKSLAKTQYFWKALTVDLAFSVLKYLQEEWQYLENLQMMHYFFHPPSPQLVDAESYIEMERRNRELMARAGYLSIYERLNQSSAWNHENKSEFTKGLALREALGQLAIENAIS